VSAGPISAHQPGRDAGRADCRHATIAEVAEDLVRGALAEHPAEAFISLLAISVSHLEKQPMLQLELSLGLADEPRRPGSRRGASRWLADKALDKVRDRWGWEAIGYGSVVLEGRRNIPTLSRARGKGPLILVHTAVFA